MGGFDIAQKKKGRGQKSARRNRDKSKIQEIENPQFQFV